MSKQNRKSRRSKHGQDHHVETRHEDHHDENFEEFLHLLKSAQGEQDLECNTITQAFNDMIAKITTIGRAFLISRDITNWVLEIQGRVQSNKDSAALETAKRAINHLSQFDPQPYPLELATLQLLLDSEEKAEKISSLTNEVVRLVDNTKLQTTQDDRHFKSKLSGAFNEVEEFVYRAFKGVSPAEAPLGENAKRLLRKMAGEQWLEWLKKDHISLLTSVMTKELVKHMLEQPLISFSKHDSLRLQLVLPAIKQSLIKNTDEDIKWRTRTIGSLTHNQHFEEILISTANSLAYSLLTKFAPPNLKKSLTKLASVIKEAGEVSMECQQQPSQFQYMWFPPGIRCTEVNLEHISVDRHAGEELHKRKEDFVIAMTVSPAVLRVDHRTKQEVIIVKAKVVLEELPEESGDESSDEAGAQTESGDDEEEEDESDEDEEDNKEEERDQRTDPSSIHEEQGNVGGGKRSHQARSVRERSIGQCKSDGGSSELEDVGTEAGDMSKLAGHMSKLARCLKGSKRKTKGNLKKSRTTGE